jgi:GntR family transcriptional regulator, rspAB operon transcriptional repressor
MVDDPITFELRVARESNLSGTAYEKLRTMILLRQIPGGTILIEGRLAEELRISRTPMREALVRLSGEGLLVREATRSYSVRRITPVEYFHAMKVRELLECEAITLSMGKVDAAIIAGLKREVRALSGAMQQESSHWEADDHVHLLFADSCGNGVLANLIRDVRVTTRLFEIMSPFRRIREDADEHIAILTRFGNGDVKEARKAMVAHLNNLRLAVMKVLSGS